MSADTVVIGLSAWLASCALVWAFVAGAKRGRGDDGDEVQG